MWWGKLLGGVFGFMIGGPLGAIVGAAFGHNFDRGLDARLTHDAGEDELSIGDTERVRMAFFTATFAVMGHIAKSDGRVHKSEIALAEAIMERMSLNAELRDAAIKLFNQGKQADFELRELVLQFRQECQRRTSLYRMFLEIQIQAALADGELVPQEEAVLKVIADVLGFPDFVYQQIEALVRASMGLGSRSYQQHQHNRAPAPSASVALDDAYQLLGATAEDDKASVKRAYRRLMSQHHPDKLVAKGLPEEMVKLATDKTQQIQKAYERIKEARGWP